ncbi:MAG: succinylglutamate desuccinylase/aspartoacylase family protein [Cyanophyceae cyanobacterium]
MTPEISTVDVLQLASGDRLQIQIYQFKGAQPGKKAYLQANLHGAEIVGNAVIERLIQFLGTLTAEQLVGEIWLVPACNPVSTNQRSHFFSTGRYNSYDGKDWNRIWDYEAGDIQTFAQAHLDLDPEEIRTRYLSQLKGIFQQQLADIQRPSSVEYGQYFRFQLQSLCLDANYVIDLHSSSNHGIDYLYCFHSREASAPYLLLEYGILMKEYDGISFDEAFMKPWLELEAQFAQLGHPVRFDVESWTLELGTGMQLNPISVDKGVAGIKNYLIYKGMLAIADSHPLASTAITLVEKSRLKKYYAPTGGMIQHRVPLRKTVQAGEKLYQILRFSLGQLPIVVDVCAEQDGLVYDVSTNEAVNQGEYVLSMMNARN